MLRYRLLTWTLVAYLLPHQHSLWSLNTKISLLWNDSHIDTFLFTLKMSMFCHSIILSTIFMLMTLNLTFPFLPAVHSVRHSIVDVMLTSLYGCLPTTLSSALTRVKCSSFKAVSALCKIFPSLLTTLQWPLLPVNYFSVLLDNCQLAITTLHTCILVLHVSQFTPALKT